MFFTVPIACRPEQDIVLYATSMEFSVKYSFDVVPWILNKCICCRTISKNLYP